MHVTVERDRCVTSGQCVLQAPAVFDQAEDDGQVVVLQADPAAEQYERVRRAMSMCPTSVITLSE